MKKYKVSPSTIIMYDNETGEEISRSDNHVIGNIFGEYKMEKPFEVGQKVTKWEDYKELMGKTTLTVTRIEESSSQSGWCVWASAEVCPHCGMTGEEWKDLDSDWFVSLKTFL